MMYTDSRKFIPRVTQGNSIRLLNKLRNEFVHFTPRVWALDLKGLPVISKDCVEIAEFLAWQSFNVTWAEDDLIRRAKNAFKSAHNSLSTFGDIVKTKKKRETT